MTESDYISELKSRWPTDEAANRETSLETLALADEAVQAFPQSAELWVIRGNLLELGPENCPLPRHTHTNRYTFPSLSTR